MYDGDLVGRDPISLRAGASTWKVDQFGVLLRLGDPGSSGCPGAVTGRPDSAFFASVVDVAAELRR
ncbi:hypothetical protein [Actinophytocola sediminis]